MRFCVVTLMILFVKIYDCGSNSHLFCFVDAVAVLMI